MNRARTAIDRLLCAVCAAAMIAAAAGAATSEPARSTAAGVERVEGGIVRGPTDHRRLAIVFTGHQFAEGADTILDVLSRSRAHASFFLTGTFLRNPAYATIVARMVREGHLVGPHSDAHLLYCPWTGPKITLVSRATFTADVGRNLDALERFGIQRDDVRYFLPSCEWYNEEIAEWARSLGLTLVSFTPGTRSNADYTEEGTAQFVSSQEILETILRREREDPRGLNGYILLLHIGAGPGRTDKFHRRFDRLLEVLSTRDYDFVRLDALLDG